MHNIGNIFILRKKLNSYPFSQVAFSFDSLLTPSGGSSIREDYGRNFKQKAWRVLTHQESNSSANFSQIVSRTSLYFFMQTSELLGQTRLKFR